MNKMSFLTQCYVLATIRDLHCVRIKGKGELDHRDFTRMANKKKRGCSKKRRY